MAKKATAWNPVPGRYGSIWLPGKMRNGGQPAPEPGPDPVGTITFNWTLAEESGGGYTYIDTAPIIEGIDNPPTLIVGQLQINVGANYLGAFRANRLVIQFMQEETTAAIAIGNPLGEEEALNFKSNTTTQGVIREFTIVAAGADNTLGIDPEVSITLPLYSAVVPDASPHDYWEVRPYDYLEIWPETPGAEIYQVVNLAHDGVLIDQNKVRHPPANPRPYNLVGYLSDYTFYYYPDESSSFDSWAEAEVTVRCEILIDAVEDTDIFIVIDYNDGEERLLASYGADGNDAIISRDFSTSALIEEDAWDIGHNTITKLKLEKYEAEPAQPYQLSFVRIGEPQRVDNYLTATYEIGSVLGGTYSAELKVYQYYRTDNTVIAVVLELEMHSSQPFRQLLRLIYDGQGGYGQVLMLDPLRDPEGRGHSLVTSFYEYVPDRIAKLSPELETLNFELHTGGFLGRANERATDNFSLSIDPFEGLPTDPDIEDLRVRLGVKPQWFDLPNNHIRSFSNQTEHWSRYKEFLIPYTGLLIRTSIGHCVEIGLRPRQLDRLETLQGDWKITVNVAFTNTTIEFLVDLGSPVRDQVYDFSFPITQTQWNGMQSSTWGMMVSIERP